MKRQKVFTLILCVFVCATFFAFSSENMILVKSGEFMMGNTRNDNEGEGIEVPVHIVKISYDYYIGKYEVTFEDYDLFCDETGKQKPSDKTVLNLSMGRGKNPVVNISWYDAIKYCNWLSKKEGLAKAYDNEGNLLDKVGNRTNDITQIEGYRLPTEAEWEYAARGGQKSIKDYKYAGSNDIDEVAWYWCDSIHNIGQKKANELGLFHIHPFIFILHFCFLRVQVN